MHRRVRSLLASSAIAAITFAAPVAAQSIDFDTSALPSPPTTFEEQKLWDSITTARSHPSLAQQAHAQLADYYDRHGKSALAARERNATGGAAPTQAPPATAAPTTSVGAAAPATPVPPTAASSSVDPTDATAFELSGFPSTPTTFDEQRILESLHDPHTLSNPTLLAFAHRQLGRYYAAQGRVDLAGTEYARAILAQPTDPNAYRGLAALHEAAGSDPGDGTSNLRDLSQALSDAGYGSDAPTEPEPVVATPPASGQWQETTAEFNRRMNNLYTSSAWSGVYRTVFSGGLYP